MPEDVGSPAGVGPPIVVVGAGGHARVVIDALQAAKARVVSILDRNPSLWGTQMLGVPVMSEDEWAATADDTVSVVIAVVGFGEGLVRRRLVRDWSARGSKFATVIHPGAVVSPHAKVGAGAQVMARAVLNPGANVGAHAIVNTSTVVEHDCVIGEGTHLSPGVVLGGGVRIGPWAQVGLQATVLPGISIGEGAIVGAGAVVNSDVPANTLVTGVPARARRQAQAHRD